MTSPDVIVVGSGASGSLLAAKLAESGRKVLILEAGPDRGEQAMISSTLYARRWKWNGAPVVEEGKNPIGHGFNAGLGVGGAASHHYAVWPRMHASDFSVRAQHGVGLDWPIDYDDLRPYYDQVQHDCGIAGDEKQEKWRPPGAPYPMPGVPMFSQGRVLKRGFDALGMTTAPLPLAVTTTNYNDRDACIWDGWCDAGCPIGALANPQTVYLPRAKAAGAELRVRAEVTRVLMDSQGRRATGVEYVDADGATKTVSAGLVILAAFAVQNVRLLLHSTSDRHPQGLGNAGDALGRYIMCHSAALVYGLFEENTTHYLGAFGGQLVCQDSYPKQTHAEAGAFGSYQWMIAQAVKPNDLLGIAPTRPDLFGKPLADFMQRAAKGFGSMTGVIEDLPVADNRITLHADRKDANGVPLARAVHTCHPKTNALWQAALEEGKRIFQAADATEVWTGPQGMMHIMGGTVMGADPESSVTDSYGRVHGLRNLYVAGPGLFPTSAGVNPTFTVKALAARTAARLIDRQGTENAAP